MPELPEVETIKNQLAKALPLKIKSVKFSEFSNSIVKSKEFSLINKQIESIDRYGKILIFVLNNDKYILSQLGMSGSWRISLTPLKIPHNHIAISCKNEKDQHIYLNYVDPRRFGNLHLLKKISKDEFITKRGVDVSSDLFSDDYMKIILKKNPMRPIKPLLLEQKYFAGIGNYIASEMCALAGVRPTRKCKNITKKEICLLIDACKSVITQNIESNGMTFHGGYVDTDGNPGRGVQNLVVFNQSICGICCITKVKKILQSQRGTYYCPKCQK